MESSRSDRFVDTAAPAQGSSQGKELQTIEQWCSLNQAVLIFMKERELLPLLQNACKKAEAILCHSQVGTNLQNLCTLERCSRVAIVAYTLEEPKFYKEFNSESRKFSLPSWNSFPYKGMWLLLNKAILSHGNLPSCHTVYRCTTAVINASPNTTFSFGQITSTSLDPNVAQYLCKGVGTLFTIKTSRCLSIKALSVYPMEEEYILPAFDTFIVTKVDNTGSCRMIFLEYLNLCHC